MSKEALRTLLGLNPVTLICKQSLSTLWLYPINPGQIVPTFVLAKALYSGHFLIQKCSSNIGFLFLVIKIFREDAQNELDTLNSVH